MADKKISQFDETLNPTLTAFLPIVDEGANKRIALTTILAQASATAAGLVQDTAATVGTTIASVSATLKTQIDGKQASGSYAASAHSHAVSDVTGLQDSLTTAVAQASAVSKAYTEAYANNNFVPLSGGSITGNLSVLGNLTYIDTSVAVTSAMYIDTSSSETALRITQKGSGDVIRVEDSDNPDSSPFIVNSDGLAGFGTALPNEKLTVVGNVSATGSYYGDGSNLSGIVGNSGGASAIRVLTQAEYNTITVPISSTIYIITP